MGNRAVIVPTIAVGGIARVGCFLFLVGVAVGVVLALIVFGGLA